MSHAAKLGTAVITGASAGLGKVYADRFAARGYGLLLVARRQDRLEALAAELTARHGVRVDVLPADLADPAGLAKVAGRIASDDTITVLVNNAGTSAAGSPVENSLEIITGMIALNVTALTVLTRAVLPGFQARNSGTLINIGSVVGFTGYPWVPVYGGTKAYVLNFTQALKQQLEGTKIRVQLVAPSATVSDIWDAVGIPLSDLDPATVMTTDYAVDAALAGLDSGEFITAPSVHDDALIRRFETASAELLEATQTGEPAPRYNLTA